MYVKLLTEHHLEFLSLKGGCTGSSESTLVKCHIAGNHMSRLIHCLQQLCGPPFIPRAQTGSNTTCRRKPCQNLIDVVGRNVIKRERSQQNVAGWEETYIYP